MKPEPRSRGPHRAPSFALDGVEEREHHKARSAGTGMEYYRNVRLSQEMEEAAAKVQEEVTAAYEEAERALELLRHEGENEGEELVAE